MRLEDTEMLELGETGVRVSSKVYHSPFMSDPWAAADGPTCQDMFCGYRPVCCLLLFCVFSFLSGTSFTACECDADSQELSTLKKREPSIRLQRYHWAK